MDCGSRLSHIRLRKLENNSRRNRVNGKRKFQVPIDHAVLILKCRAILVTIYDVPKCFCVVVVVIVLFCVFDILGAVCLTVCYFFFLALG